MNPPPLPPPPPGNQNSFAHQAAVGSLIAPLLAIFVSIAITAATRSAGGDRTGGMIGGSVAILLILAGFVLGIVALCGIPRHGRKKILGRSIAGLLINGALMLFMVTGLVTGMKRAAERRKATTDLQTTSRELQTSARESYDPEQGITNFDASRLNRLQNDMKNASQKLTGDDALIMEVMGNHVTRMQKALKKYETAMTSFRDGNVLGLEHLTEKSQLETRRELVRTFLAANTELTHVIANAEKNLRAELANTKITPAKVEAVIAGFNSKAVPRNALILKIRECDQRLGDAALGTLDLFDSHWGTWRYNATGNQVTFEQNLADAEYNRFRREIDTAAREQVELQGKLVKLP